MDLSSSDPDYQHEVTAELNVHVFSVSAAMVGVCLTVVGIIRVVISSDGAYATVADDLLALDSVVFVVACLLAYSSLRSTTSLHANRFQRLADITFLSGLLLMTGACLLIAFSIL